MAFLSARCNEWRMCLYNNNIYNGLYRTTEFFFSRFHTVPQNVPGVGILSLGDSSLANWASVLLREPLLDAVHMVAMATFQPSHLLVRFKFFLTDTAFPLHFCCETERAIGWVLDLPNAAGNLILTQPCVDIPDFVSKLEQLLICHVIHVKAPILVAIIHAHSSQ
jgi:hypothetical protein